MSIRTVIVLSALSETTIPWRTFAGLRTALGGRRAGTGLALLGAPALAVAAPVGGLGAARLEPRGGALLDRLLRAGLVRAPRTLQPPPVLPGQVGIGVWRGLLGRQALRRRPPPPEPPPPRPAASSAGASSASDLLLFRGWRRGCVLRRVRRRAILGDRTRGRGVLGLGLFSLFGLSRSSLRQPSAAQFLVYVDAALVRDGQQAGDVSLGGLQPRRCSRARRSSGGSAG